MFRAVEKYKPECPDFESNTRNPKKAFSRACKKSMDCSWEDYMYASGCESNSFPTCNGMYRDGEMKRALDEINQREGT
jgi:hypothetical protein